MSQSPGPAGLSRRRLPKSKTGCRTCKKRRVKCDEGRPACHNCVKRGVKCDLIAPGPSNPSPVDLSTQMRLCDHESSECFQLSDLELLHHFTTSTCLTFSTDPTVRDYWRVNVPQIGLTTPYILKALFSISALHMAKFKLDRKEFYTAQALLHHNAALKLVSPLFSTITAENCVQLFLFSTLTNYFAFAKPREPDSFLLTRHGVLPEWLMLLRGVRAVMETEHANTVIRHSSASAMFEKGFAMHEYWLAHTFENEPLTALETNVCDTMQHEPEHLGAMVLAIDALKRSFAIVYGGPQLKVQSDDDKVRGIFIWLFKISDEFIALVGEGNNQALCILAYFCALVRRLDFLWWMEGWGLHLIERIYSRLNDSYRCWIRWPIEETGWVPSSEGPLSF